MDHTSHRVEFLGAARPAGRNVLHAVTADGVEIGTRRSAHRYNYAFVKRTGPMSFIVTRWSRKPTVQSRQEHAVYLPLVSR